MEKTKGFMFNQAPINKRAAQAEANEKFAEKRTGKKRSAFMAKLYDEDGADAFDDEMKVFDMNRKLSDIEDDANDDAIMKSKKTSKSVEKKGKGKAVASGSKINKLVSNTMMTNICT